MSPDAELGALIHSDYSLRFPQWTRVRDCVEGQDQIKGRKEIYLPRRVKQSDASYEADLKRTVFFNATARTRQALLSSIFRRPGVVRLPNGINAESVTRNGMSVRKVARWLAEEVITVTRAGGLVDLPAEESYVPEPFLCLYPAEHILSWSVDRGVLRMVLLAERIADESVTANMFNVRGKWSIRMLALDENGEYYQLTGTPQTFSNMMKPPVAGRIYPEVYGKRLTSIPFQFFGAVKNDEQPEKPLMLDIADMNLAHYISYSNLERARAFVGSPIYTTFTDGKAADNDDPLIVSPEIVWEFGTSEKAEILEFRGTSMSSLENGLEEKEEQMRILGARLMSQRKNAAARSSESDSQGTNSDDATLGDVVDSVSSGLQNLLTIMADWKRLRKSEVEILLNKHFNAPNIGARELRAIDACLNRSLRPEDIFTLLQESGMIAEDQNKEEYVSWIEKLREQQEAATRAKLNQPVTPPAQTSPSSRQTTGPGPGSTNSG